MRLGLGLAAFLALAGCGYLGPPRAPTLDIPAAAADLAAGEYGANIVVHFTLPAVTTDGLDLKTVQSAELFIGPGPNPFSTAAWAASAQRFEIPNAKPGPIFHQVPAAEWIGKDVVVGVRATGPKGKVSDWSNLRPVPVGTPLVKPTAVKAENKPRGVGFTWQGAGPNYRVFRAVDRGPLMVLGETTTPDYLDETTMYGTQYTYQVLAFSGDTQQSEISEPAMITPVDIYPPAVPSGLTVSMGVNSIQLAWLRNAESDLQGYYVYRSAEGAAFEKSGELVQTPVYSDARVESGKRYRYAVSAVDTSGNESARSEPVEAVAP